MGRDELALAFEHSSASSVELHVEGRDFYPPMLADIAQRPPLSTSTSSVSVRSVGDRFAAALISKAQEGVPVRLIVDRQGSDPERGSREFYERLTEAGIHVCVTRATKLAYHEGLSRAGGAVGWNLGGLGHIDHRKAVVIDGRIGWVGGAGIEDHFENGEFHDLFVRVEGPVVSQLQLVFVASQRWLGGEIPTRDAPGAVPTLERARAP